ncbi:unnamed protein product [Eretmochelys imbricata]
MLISWMTMTSSNCKRRKYEEKLFSQNGKKILHSLVKVANRCALSGSASRSHHKASNLKHHYKTNHINFSSKYPPGSELRKNKLTALKLHLNCQQTLLLAFRKETDMATEASFVMAWNITCAKHLYCDGEFVKNIEEVVAILDPSNTKLQQVIQQIPISCHAMEKQISQISADVASEMQNNLKNSLAFSLAVDESTDIQDKSTASDICFLCFLRSNRERRNVGLNGAKGNKCVDIKNALDKALTNINVPLDKLVSVATDGAPAMVGGEK